MKKFIGVFIAVVSTLGPVLSQQPETSSLSAPPPVTPTDTSAPRLSADELETLVGPIALYPDPMISLILPASTVPTDIVLAARYIRDNQDTSQIDAQNWDPSVKGLARYPDVLNMMNENLDWTNQLGAAVIAQQADVMAAIQAQRVKAKDLGNLQSTPQQTVVVEKTIVQIVPADPQVIYVPTYNPAVVYVQPAPPAAPFITFGAGLALGIWIGGGCDWNHHSIYTHGCWGSNGWNNNNISINNSTNININNNNNSWHPNGNRPPPRPPYNPNRPGAGGGGSQLPGVKPAPPGGWSGGNNRPGGNTPNNRPGGIGGGAGNGNRPGANNPATRPGGGGNNPNVRPGGGETKPATRPGAGGTQNDNLKPAQNFKKPATGSSNRPMPDLGGANNRFKQEGTKPATGGFQRPAGGGGAARGGAGATPARAGGAGASRGGGGAGAGAATRGGGAAGAGAGARGGGGGASGGLKSR